AGSVTATVLCEKVMVEFRNPDDATFTHHGGRTSEELKGAAAGVTREEVRTEGAAYQELVRNFLAAVRGEEPMRSGIDDGVEGLRLVLAVARSSDAGGAPQQVG